MNTTRREFLKRSGQIGLAVGAASLLRAESATSVPNDPGAGGAGSAPPSPQSFNMCGYVAPRLETVRIGIIGLGHRGSAAVKRLSRLEGVAITALCDLRETSVANAVKSLVGTSHHPATYTGADTWKHLCDRADVDLVYICTPWDWHTPMAVFAMHSSKHAAVEVPAATTLEQCWELVETSEQTKKYCRMLENCCYDEFELLTLNMARLGVFGDIVHGEGAYIHENVFHENFDKNYYYGMWRLKENFRNGNLYPTHGLGPVCQIMNINRGDRLDYMVSMSSADFQMEKKADELAAQDPFFAPFAHRKYRGNMNTSMMRTGSGRTIMLQHDVTSPRPYSRIHLVSGTKGVASKYPLPPKIAFGADWLSDADYQAVARKYAPELLRRFQSELAGLSGHGGADIVMDWRWVYCLRHGRPMDHDVYDAALWSSIAPLSEWSVAHRSQPIDVPDFTRGHWRSNAPVSMSL